MPLLQTVTSLLLLHFSRLLIISGRGRSSFFVRFSEKMAFSGGPEAIDRFLATLFFTVTTVTTNKINYLKLATGKENSFVTATANTPKAVTTLLQTVTSCNIYCHKVCNSIATCISVNYKTCDRWHTENGYLRIFHSQETSTSENTIF